MVEFILASQSPRRQSLIQLLDYSFLVMVADVDEASITHPVPAMNVVETAVLKATTIAQRTQEKDKIIIAADTTVALDGQMLGKPRDGTEATSMLRALRNRDHEVHTGFVLFDLRNGRQIEGVTTAVVTMRDYSNKEITDYVASGDPMDKAGAYAIQHPLFKPVARLAGCYTAVMGLSICDLILALDKLNVPRQADLTAVYQSHQIANTYYPCPIYEDFVSPA